MDQAAQEAACQSPQREDYVSVNREPTIPPSEFVCSGCGRPLAIVLHSTMCFAEAQVYCPDCERDYQQRGSLWQER